LTSAERSFKLLNMSSAAASDRADGAADRPDPAGRAATPPDPDRTARARIRDAAITRFAADGVAATSVRAIAEQAGVSPPLVMHHFGSKDRLRVSCDEHVAAVVRERKREAMAGGSGLDPVAALRSYDDGPPLLAYLARTLIDGSPHVAALVDEMVNDAVGYMTEGEASGMLTPTDDPRGRATVLTLWSLGALVLHEHAQRLLGVDLAGDPGHSMPYFLPALDILGRGIITQEALAQIREGLRDLPDDEDPS
jgi:AcrR family transcriptional regulator